MNRWRDRAAKATEGKPAADPAPPPATSPFAGDVRLLRSLPPPRGVRADTWREIGADAEQLVTGGWVERALALGWSGYDLFGIGPTSGAEFEGLAVWLAGRSVAALAEWQARTPCGGIFYRDAFMRPHSRKATPVYLWQFGRVR